MIARALVCIALCALACAPAEPLECDPTQQITRDNTSGLEVCGDASERVVNRVSEVTCSPAFQVSTCPATCAPDCGECNADADCAAGDICEGVNESCECFTPCARDSDCDDDEACVCSIVTGNEGGVDESVILAHPTCVPAACRTGADCESGACGLSFTNVCPRPIALACRDTERDECGVPGKDCDQGEICTTDSGPFACSGVGTCE